MSDLKVREWLQLVFGSQDQYQSYSSKVREGQYVSECHNQKSGEGAWIVSMSPKISIKGVAICFPVSMSKDSGGEIVDDDQNQTLEV